MGIAGGKTHHFHQLVTLIQMCHHYTLALWYGSIHANEPTILPQIVDLKESKLVLS